MAKIHLAALSLRPAQSLAICESLEWPTLVKATDAVQRWRFILDLRCEAVSTDLAPNSG
jgi:hypothetical protein